MKAYFRIDKYSNFEHLRYPFKRKMNELENDSLKMISLIQSRISLPGYTPDQWNEEHSSIVSKIYCRDISFWSQLTPHIKFSGQGLLAASKD
jgi:hypothetical protein